MSLTNLLVTFIFITVCHQFSFGKPPKKSVAHRVILTTTTSPKKFKGPLLEVRDSSVVVFIDLKQVEILARDIDVIVIKRQGNGGRRALLGLAIGVGVGAMIGFAGGDDDCGQGVFCVSDRTAGQKATEGAILYGLGGAVTGMLIGALDRIENISIHGGEQTFRENAAVLAKYIRFPTASNPAPQE
jgi:hypothetical protein